LYRQNQLLIYLFDGQSYQESPISRQFSEFDLKTLVPEVINRSWLAGSSVALRELEQCLAAIAGVPEE
jgi:hypothetical protein